MIGTITYHRADNYGAVLQAYALCQYLREQNLDAEIIDYWPKHHAAVYRLWCWNSRVFYSRNRIGKIVYILKFPLVLLRNYKRKKNFNLFRRRNMYISNSMRKYDAVFYGSDTIWNKWNLNSLYSGFDPTYWGSDFVKSSHRFSYAPSMGNVIDNDETMNYCKKHLPQFDKLSVREKHLKDKLVEWGIGEISITVDPTMLLPRKSWDLLAKRRIIKNDYVLCYNLESSSICAALAEEIGKECGMRVIQLTAQVSQYGNSNIYDTAGPLEFLSLFRHASYIVTSSFHGCVFSIIFNKQFCFHSYVETERISSLLDSLCLSQRFIKTSDTSVMYNPIDYNMVNNLMEQNVADSKDYIFSCLACI